MQICPIHMLINYTRQTQLSSAVKRETVILKLVLNFNQLFAELLYAVCNVLYQECFTLVKIATLTVFHDVGVNNLRTVLES